MVADGTIQAKKASPPDRLKKALRGKCHENATSQSFGLGRRLAGRTCLGAAALAGSAD
jgi:hypothetical protein